MNSVRSRRPSNRVRRTAITKRGTAPTTATIAAAASHDMRANVAQAPSATATANTLTSTES
jgi:hypothetical protein